MLAICLSAGAAHSGMAPWSLGAGLTVGRDSNLFRAPAGEAVETGYHSGWLSGGFDQTISRQRLQAEVRVRSNRYDERPDLDSTGYELQFGWRGATAGEISWNLGYDATRKPGSYATVLEADRRVANLESTRQVVAGVQLGGAAQWAVGASVVHRRVDYSAEAYAADRYATDSLALTATRHPLGPVSLSIGPRFTRGHYAQARRNSDGSFDADAFDRHDLDLALNWAASGASTISARLSGTRQRYTLLTDRDFDGATGQIAWRWQATGKTTFNAALSRDTGSETSFFTLPAVDEALQGSSDNSQLTSTLTLGVDHAVTAKTRLSLGGRYLARRLSASSLLDAGGVPVDLGSASGRDRSGQVTAGVRFAPTRTTTIACDWTHARRGADTTLSAPYRATSVSCSAQLLLR